MRTLILTAVMVLIAVCAASAIQQLHSANLAVAPPQTVTISIDGLHRQVDARSLPELKVEDLY